MTLAEAIEIKTTYVEHLPPGVNEDWIKADRLSIEGLKAWKRFREGRWVSGRYDLPGETKE